MSQSVTNERYERSVRHTRFRRVTALMGAASLLFAGSVLTLPSAEAAWNASTGKGLDLRGVNASGTLRLGPHYNETATVNGVAIDGFIQWCLNAKYADPGKDQLTSINTLTDSSQWGPDELDLTTPQMAWLLNKYQGNKDNTNLAALAYLAHSNFEQPYANGTNPQSVVNEIVAGVRSQLPQVDSLARQYVVEARNSAAVGYEKGSATGDGQRTGQVNSIGVQNSNSQWLSGVPTTVTLNGPAVFDATGTNTWSGNTQSQPITLTWRSTGNGEVSFKTTYATLVRRTLTRYGSNGAVQDMLSYGNRSASDPESVTVPGPSWRVIFDFQPQGVSHNVKISDDGSFVDTFDAAADPNYGNGQWVSVDGSPVPVVYTATAYATGTTPPTQSGVVPEGARMIDQQQVTANGPSKLEASFTARESGFATVVWTVSKAENPEYADFIHADWADAYGIPEETVSVRHNAQIDSSLSVRETKAGTYLVDDLFVTGFPDNHPEFTGDTRFQPDTKELTQDLLFFADGTEISEANAASVEKIGSVTVPAKNGFYPSVGSTVFKMKDGNTPGTYVFRTCFAGDDRVKAMCTPVTDVTEQYRVEPKPEPPTLKTTATDAADGDKTLANTGVVTLVDHVCHTNLTPGKTYRLEGALMNQATGKPVMGSDDKPVMVSTDYTPTEADACTDVVFTYDAALTAGTRTVVFERVFDEGVLLVAHTDINDEGQTVSTPDAPKVSTTASDKADSDKALEPVENAEITDKVCYENLTVGREYTLSGVLMDQATNDSVKNSEGEPVTASMLLTPSKASDCVDLTFMVDARHLGGHSLTVFERVLDMDGHVVASHEDITSVEQTVSVNNPPTPSVPPVLANTGARVVMLALVALMLVAGGMCARRYMAGRES